MTEEWKPIEGYEGVYEVSNMGNVRRRKVLKPQTNPKTGYKHVSLYWDGKPTIRLIHQLVMEAFVGPAPDGMEVCHGPNGKADNSLANLRYDTKSNNQHDKKRDGTDHNVNKTHCPRNHPLEGRNLNPSALDRGNRQCQTCSLALSFIRTRRSKGESFSKGEERNIFDRYYRKVMSDEYQRELQYVRTLNKSFKK